MLRPTTAGASTDGGGADDGKQEGCQLLGGPRGELPGADAKLTGHHQDQEARQEVQQECHSV
jgi:hypothetical protein